MHSLRVVKRQAIPPKLQDSGKAPSLHDWRTTDEDEISRRRRRAIEEQPRIENIDSREKIFSNFRVRSPSGLSYLVEVRDLAAREFSCTCVDFRINRLGTCKHVEAVLLHLEARFRKMFAVATKNGSPRIDIVPDRAAGTLRVSRGLNRLPTRLRPRFNKEGLLVGDEVDEAIALCRDSQLPALRLSQDVEPWLESRRHAEERVRLRREYEQKVQCGTYPPHETLVPLFPYQREGMLHLAFTERALLADEMGLGKTIQAIAACALLLRMEKAHRVLIITPASLKTEWEEQIQKFTRLPYQLVFGQRRQRLASYDTPPFFTIVNYEQMLSDALDVNTRLRPDIVVLDEAQRIKNWSTKTAQAIKRLESRYAFVLTGTPIENRIDELFSIIGFLDPAIFGPLFRFNRDFYQLDDRGRPEEYRNLGKLHARIRPLMLRRRKADVETELPSRTDRNHFVAMSESQRATYEEHAQQVTRLVHTAKRRPLTKQEQDKLMRELAMMRMICDTNYILDANDRACPKLAELKTILEECCADKDVKILIFSEWVRMLELVREVCVGFKLGYAWHTGSVAQRRRRAEIQMFKSDPGCRVFLTTDSGGVGLNLQNASVVINCDLPWNPAKLEQRIARAWRKHQTRNVTVINLVSLDTIEHRMLGTLQAKQGLSDGVLDQRGDLSQIKLRGGAQAFLTRLQQVIDVREPAPRPLEPPLPVDRAEAFVRRAARMLDGKLVACEERFPIGVAHSVLVAIVERDADTWREKLRSVHADLFGPGKLDPLAPVQLEVIDRATAEALERMADAGLIAPNVRATRHLHPSAEEASASLNAEEQAKAAAFRERAGRKLKMARILAGGEFMDEAGAALGEAILFAGKALAFETRLSEPESIADALVPPLAVAWGAAVAALRRFVEGGDLMSALDAVAGKLEERRNQG